MRPFPASAPEGATSGELRQVRNGRSFALWAFIFIVAFIGLRPVFGMSGWEADSIPAIALSLVPLIPGTMAFRAFMRLYRESDEMQREMLVEGVVTGAAFMMIVWGMIQLPEHIWLPRVKADILMSVFCLGFSVGMIRARRRRA